jgi:PTH1 family peptidyl-tRNA hydrolase
VSVFRRAAERRGTPADHLVVGIGNPGEEYRDTRHNLGFEVVERLVERHGGDLRSSRAERARVGVISLAGKRVVTACPDTFMNLSGESVRPLVKRHGITDPGRVIVVHDELDLEPGRLKVKAGGSAAGHNGLKSIAQHLGTPDFVRVRVGVGKPPHKGAGKSWVLKRLGKADRELFDEVVDRAADAVEMLIRDGLDAAMNTFNAR